tara:strand:- start:835 stop:2910 length:2076 start_codon:yes stop_codon:yes gene_type:complete
LKAEDVQYWRKSIDNAQKFMAPKHKDWRRLLAMYRMEFEVPDLDKDQVVRISRFYPLTRQIISSIAYNYPHVFLRVEDPNREYQAEILERVANAALETMQVKEEMQQAIFDALYCSLGWLKFDYNAPGDDLLAPYVVNDALQDDMVAVRRVPPFNVFVDPLCPPHKLSHARYIVERMLVPLEFVKKDERFVNRRQVTAINSAADSEETLYDIEDREYASQDEENAVQQAKDLGDYALLYEVHDRVHRRRIVFAEGVEQPIEDIPHPFLEQEPVYAPDPFTGEEMMTGEFNPTGSYLVQGGFPYHAIKFDLSEESLYGLPMMGYVEDEQKAIVESVSRRVDLLKRYPRIILGQRSEREENANISDQLTRARDGQVVWVNDINNGFREMQMGNPPPDQLGIEADMRNYEEQVLNVSQMAMGGGPRRTATEASLIASFGTQNREWLSAEVGKAYEAVIYNTFRIMADPRYTPDKFIVNVSEGENDPIYEAVSSDLFKVRFKVEVETQSMRPLFEQLEREDTLALANYLFQMPEVNRSEVIKLVLRAFRVSDMDKFIKTSVDAEATRAAQLENQFMAARQQDPGVLPTQDHKAHLQAHAKAGEDPAVTQFLQQQMQINPQSIQQFQQMMQAHVQQHQQFLQGQAQGQPMQDTSDKTIPSARDGASVQAQASALQSVVRSNAQRVGQTVSLNTEQN